MPPDALPGTFVPDAPAGVVGDWVADRLAGAAGEQVAKRSVAGRQIRWQYAAAAASCLADAATKRR